MFVEAVVFLAAIVGVLLALSAFVFHMITRQPEEEPEKVEQAVDAAADAALEEITKTAQSVLDELNEKYNALLFVYQLMDDKKKEIDGGEHAGGELAGDKESGALAASLDLLSTELDISVGDELELYPLAYSDIEGLEAGTGGANSSAKMPDTSVAELAMAAIEGINPSDETVAFGTINPAEAQKLIAHPRFDEIKELQDEGLSLPEIARNLDMGQGEVSLIIGLSGR